MKKQEERRKGEEGRSLTSAFNEAMMRPVWGVSCLEDDNECIAYVSYMTAVNSNPRSLHTSDTITFLSLCFILTVY